MERPILHTPFAVAEDTHVLPGYLPVPGMGVLPANAFLVRGREPTLIDTGVAALAGDLLAKLEELLDPRELRYIWLTHADPDHVGALAPLLERAERARVVTTYLGMGKLGMLSPVPPERVCLVNPGQLLDLGDRSLHALRPPTYDAPETTGCYDARTGALFSADCFGALLDAPHALASDIPETALREGLITWTTVDAPWLHTTDGGALDRRLSELNRLAPSLVLSAHLPPAPNMTPTLIGHLREARTAEPFVGPDQAMLEGMLGGVMPPVAETQDCSRLTDLA